LNVVFLNVEDGTTARPTVPTETEKETKKKPIKKRGKENSKRLGRRLTNIKRRIGLLPVKREPNLN